MLKNYMQIDELQVEEAFDLQTEELNADRRTICRLKNNLYLNNCLQTKELFQWQIEECYADQLTIYRLMNYLLVE